MGLTKPALSDLRSHWLLDPEIVYLNHGSFGATPRVVLEAQTAVRQQLEREPARFFVRELEPLYQSAREALGGFLGADPDGLAFVDNATSGLNTILRSLSFSPGDELVVTNQEYNASRNALDYVARRSGAQVVVAEIPFPIRDAAEAVDAIESVLTERTRLVLFDHIVSTTGLVLPVERIVEVLNRRGIPSLIDGAHAPGQVPLDLRSLGATYYTGNCHKWLCAPKGAAFLYVDDRSVRASVRPLVISHGANAAPSAGERFRVEFDWLGTRDPTPYLMIPEALAALPTLVGSDWSEIMALNHVAALKAREIVAEVLGLSMPCPEDMVGSMASLVLPGREEAWEGLIHPLQERLFQEFRIEVPIAPWPTRADRVLRISAQVYNTEDEFHYLASSLEACL